MPKQHNSNFSSITWIIKSALLLILIVGCKAPQPEATLQDPTTAPTRTPMVIAPTTVPTQAPTSKPTKQPTITSANSDETDIANEMLVQLEEIDWVLSAYHFGEPPARGVLEGVAVTLDFSDGTITGSTGCNQYEGKYAVESGRLVIEMVVKQGSKTCLLPMGIMDQESLFFEVLTATPEIELQDNRLTLDYENGGLFFYNSLVRINRRIENTKWAFYGFVEGDEVRLPDEMTIIDFALGDGQVSGFAGCNIFFGDYDLNLIDLSGGDIVFRDLATTHDTCEEALMADELAFIELMGSAEHYAIEGDVLTINHSKGSLLFNGIR